jgi:hypothetical protein
MGLVIACAAGDLSSSTTSTTSPAEDLDRLVAKALLERDLDYFVRLTDVQYAACLGSALTDTGQCANLCIADYISTSDSNLITITVEFDASRNRLTYFKHYRNYSSSVDRAIAFYSLDSVVTILDELGYDSISTPQILHCAIGGAMIIDCTGFGRLFWKFQDLRDEREHLHLKNCSVVPFPAQIGEEAC